MKNLGFSDDLHLTDLQPTVESLPRRVANAERASKLYGDLLPRLVSGFEVGDPLADAAIESLQSLPQACAHRSIAEALKGAQDIPEPLIALVQAARELPPWLDIKRAQNAGEIFFRAGLLGELVLGARSLVYGYASPVGNKPLAFSGALEKKAGRRLAETGRFIQSVSRRGGMFPDAEGFHNTVHVRLMHAQVRRLTLQNSRWRRNEWGVPINQHDMLATTILFSTVFVDGIRKLGIRVSDQEADDFQHLWRWIGTVMGVSDDLLPRSYAAAERMAKCIRLTQGAPDDDSRTLVEALLSEPMRAARSPQQRVWAARHTALARGICRALIDKETADALGIHESYASSALNVVTWLVRGLEHLRHHVPAMNGVVNFLGSEYWKARVEHGLNGGGTLFSLPQFLFGSRALGRG